VEFFVANANKEADLGSKSAGHPGVWARLAPPRPPADGR
jgi:hypothetical protein